MPTVLWLISKERKKNRKSGDTQSFVIVFSQQVCSVVFVLEDDLV